jgi:glutamine amidotransferase
MITIVDYGLGNLGSVENMLRRIGAKCLLSSNAAVISQASKLILPGVGAFDQGMRNLKERGLVEVLHQKVIQEKTPILGLCLGMQLFTRSSEEGNLPGFGWLDADTVKFRLDDGRLRIPHIGWNEIEIQQSSPIFFDFEGPSRFYFVHSYHLICRQPEDVLAMTDYGYSFPSIVQHSNILGMQFHPEKSHKFGMKILKNFVEFL